MGKLTAGRREGRKGREERARCDGLKMKENMKNMGGELEEKQIG